MCGIAGIVQADQTSSASPRIVRAMCDRLAHRGPDDSGEYVQGPVGMGMRRLSIIDLETGRQPISNEDGTIQLVFNGEIYNHRQLRAELIGRGHRFRSHSDAEVIVHLYEETSERCVERLRGMFAFAIWDSVNRRCLLARDRLGIKPLYFAPLDEALVFGSELKAILAHPGVARDVDPDAVVEYFTHLCVPGHLSIFKAVRKLLPGHVLTYRDGRLETARYWHVQPNPDMARSEADWIEELRARLRDAVESHMLADVPVGAFLSGGLDSGAMVALMARASREPVRTFTVGFSTDSGRFDERTAARELAGRYATSHRECLLEPDVSEILPRIVQAFDEPFADSSAIPNWLICRETSRHVKAALSGLGGDELFGGYERYVGLQMGQHYQRLPSTVRRAIAGLMRRIPSGNGSSYGRDRLKRFVAAGELTPVERYRSFIAAFDDVTQILHPDVSRAAATQRARYHDVVEHLQIHDSLDLGLFTDLYLYIPDDLLVLSDRISMAHSLEVRVPYLDHQLVEFVARMPASLKVRGLQKKVILRRAVAPWLPREHLARPKQGFSVPVAGWLRGPLRELLSDLVESQELRQCPWLSYPAVRALVSEHLSGKANHENRLWAILCFHEWERQHSLATNPQSA